MTQFRNHFIVVGHAGAEPVLRSTLAGGLVATVNVATNYRHRNSDSGQWTESTEWHRITAFDRLATVLGEHVRKGTRVGVEGYMRTRKFVDASHQDRYVHELVATRIETNEAAGAIDDAGTRKAAADGTSQAEAAGQDVRVI